MLLTISTTHRPATDLGFLLHKNPANAHSFELSFGKAHLFYPEATEERCTAALLLDVDPVGLVRGKGAHGEGGTLEQYVNDRPYVLSSFTSVAIGRALGTAMTGRSKGRQELASQKLPLTRNAAGDGLPRWRWFAARTLRTAGVPRTCRAPSPRREISGLGRRPLLHRDARRRSSVARSAAPPVRLDPGARRREALLGRER